MKEQTIFFQVRGSGKPVVLLHGFPMNQRVWNEFATELSKDFTVYTPDLPGLGQSEILPSPFSIEDVADTLLLWMEEQNIMNSVLIGHSLGGYVALAMVEKKPSAFSGMGLFHSTAYADTVEKRKSRTKTVAFIKKNGVHAFTTDFIKPLFADPTHPSIQSVREISMEASEAAVLGYTVAMRDRIERLNILEDFKKPVLFIAGKLDQGIPSSSVQEQASRCQEADLHILTNTAHMGMFERKDQAIELVRAFVNRCI